MKERLRALCYGMLVWGVTGFIGCAPVEPLPPPPSTQVSVSTFKSAAGKWAGILKAIPPLRDDDWVTLTISDDGGYEFVSIRMIGIFHGKGTFTLIDGKLRTETERGWALVTLYEDGASADAKGRGSDEGGHAILG